MDCSLPGSSVQGIFQARVLEWGAIAFSPGETKPPEFNLINMALQNLTERLICVSRPRSVLPPGGDIKHLSLAISGTPELLLPLRV